MVESTDEPIKFVAAETKLRVTSYDSKMRKAEVEFDPPFRFSHRDKKYEVPGMSFRGEQIDEIYRICPGSTRNGQLKAGHEFTYSPGLARGLAIYRATKREGYGLKITKVSDDGVKIRIYPGEQIRGKKGTIKTCSGYFTRTQLNKLNPVFASKEPKVGTRFAVDKDLLTQVYTEVYAPAQTDQVITQDVPIRDENSKLGLENKVESEASSSDSRVGDEKVEITEEDVAGIQASLGS